MRKHKNKRKMQDSKNHENDEEGLSSENDIWEFRSNDQKRHKDPFRKDSSSFDENECSNYHYNGKYPMPPPNFRRKNNNDHHDRHKIEPSNNNNNTTSCSSESNMSSNISLNKNKNYIKPIPVIFPVNMPMMRQPQPVGLKQNFDPRINEKECLKYRGKEVIISNCPQSDSGVSIVDEEYMFHVEYVNEDGSEIKSKNPKKYDSDKYESESESMNVTEKEMETKEEINQEISEHYQVVSANNNFNNTNRQKKQSRKYTAGPGTEGDSEYSESEEIIDVSKKPSHSTMQHSYSEMNPPTTFQSENNRGSPIIVYTNDIFSKTGQPQQLQPPLTTNINDGNHTYSPGSNMDNTTKGIQNLLQTFQANRLLPQQNVSNKASDHDGSTKYKTTLVSDTESEKMAKELLKALSNLPNSSNNTSSSNKTDLKEDESNKTVSNLGNLLGGTAKNALKAHPVVGTFLLGD
nr:GATA zinc finger domain-containing protein 14-like [Lepeophtheirus salmonis]